MPRIQLSRAAGILAGLVGLALAGACSNEGLTEPEVKAVKVEVRPVYTSGACSASGTSREARVNRAAGSAQLMRKCAQV